jgi:hypothetical protein
MKKGFEAYLGIETNVRFGANWVKNECLDLNILNLGQVSRN